MSTTEASSTVTLTLEEPPLSSTTPQSVVLCLRVPKKKVSWKEGTVDNEFLNKKSSKKCCIFHKQKPFDEDYSDDESDHDHGDDGKNGDNHDHGDVGEV
ncbi:Protein phosphatase 1 regulatory subunit 11 [Zostera marina]|uniref:Protein phosphatase 1 regulatory subunit 11 n=1 Tax=Zostera marina TaxID=29655 RepID=A0A0K9PW85_ZOSMR|nr:Protein phosphatase 1 regulatory subunit 11 [Zostera marina]